MRLGRNGTSLVLLPGFHPFGDRLGVLHRRGSAIFEPQHVLQQDLEADWQARDVADRLGRLGQREIVVFLAASLEGGACLEGILPNALHRLPCSFGRRRNAPSCHANLVRRLNHRGRLGSTERRVMDGVLRADGVAAFRGERLVLEGVSLAVAPGGALLLLGPNGSGKSTLLRLLAGLKRPDAGTISGPENPAYLGHADAIKAGLTVSENLRFAAAGRPVGAALEALGLAALADLPARMLSAGQRAPPCLGPLDAEPLDAVAAGRADAGAGHGLARAAGAIAGRASGGWRDGDSGDPPGSGAARCCGAAAGIVTATTAPSPRPSPAGGRGRSESERQEAP